MVRKQVLCFLDEFNKSLNQFARILEHFAIGISQGAVFVAEITNFKPEIQLLLVTDLVKKVGEFIGELKGATKTGY